MTEAQREKELAANYPAIEYTDAVAMAFERVCECPVSGDECEHYRDCEVVGYCWLK